MAQGCGVVTYELEHIDAALVEAIEAAAPGPPGPAAAARDPGPPRGAALRGGERASPSRPGGRSRPATTTRSPTAVAELGTPLRLKAAFGGYDGRSQVRVATARRSRDGLDGPRSTRRQPVLVEQELEFTLELSVVCARSVDGITVPFPVASNVHDDGILAESVMPAEVPDAVAAEAQAIAVHLADAMDLVGLLTVELFLLPDGALVVNELAPRVHNSGHATIEASATSQFEQHIRAICGLPPGLRRTAVARRPWSTSWATAPAARPASTGVADALADPAVHLHLYDKREVFERRKMGHLTALGARRDDGARAHGRGRAQLALGWMP